MNKNLIIFSYDFPPSNGGIARLCHEISIGALKYYEKVIVLTRRKNGISKPYNSVPEVDIKECDSRRGYCEIECFRYLRSIKNKNDYDILCALWHPETTLSLLVGFKNIYTLAHGAELLSGKSLFKKRLWLPLYGRIILSKSKDVIANSHYTRELVMKIAPKSNVVVMPLAINHVFFKPNSVENEPFLNICSVSRIQQFKGHEFVLKTIASLPINYKSKIRYNIAGTGTYLSNLKQITNDLDLTSIVSFHGFVQDELLPEFYNANDLFILCTRESSDSANVEGFGLVFLEAQACGIPVVGTRTGGIPDAVEEGNGGWLIDQDNEIELTELLIRLIDAPQLLADMGAKARLRIEKKSTLDYYCKQLFKLMNNDPS